MRIVLGCVVSNMLLSRWRVGQVERLFHLSVDLVWCGGRRLPGLPPSLLASLRAEGGLPAALVRQELLYRRKQSLLRQNRGEEKAERGGRSICPAIGRPVGRLVKLPCSDMDGRAYREGGQIGVGGWPKTALLSFPFCIVDE